MDNDSEVKNVPVIARVPNIRVCHHPQSDHLLAQGRQGRWSYFGNVNPFDAAMNFVRPISLEMIKDNPVRILVEDEYDKTIHYDLTVTLRFQYYASINHNDNQNPDSE